MSPPSFELRFTPSARDTLNRLKGLPAERARYKRVKKSLKFLQEQGPNYPGLATKTLTGVFSASNEPLRQSRLENHTPGAWRMTWIYGPGEGEITVQSIHKHWD